MNRFFYTLWRDDDGQDVAEYAVLLAVLLLVVAGTISAIGANASSIFQSSGDKLAGK